MPTLSNHPPYQPNPGSPKAPPAQPGLTPIGSPLATGKIWVGNALGQAEEATPSASAIADNSLALSKLATMATTSLLGRSTAGIGNVQVLSATDSRTVLGLGTLATQNGTVSGTNSGDETASSILAKLITVDGISSGLDADLLDGLSSAAFAAAVHTHAQSDVTGLVTALAAKQPLATVLTDTTAAFTTAQETKLAGIASAATANAADASLRDRATHTGTQEIATVTGLQSSLDAKLDDTQASAFGLTLIDDADAATALLTLGAAPLASPSFTGVPAAPTAGGGTNTTQLATTAFVAAAVSTAVAGLLELKGDLDASLNPNYPAGSVGDTYYITVAGKVGGASGENVEVGDAVVCQADNAGGTEAAVGTSWFVLEHNLQGALLTANALSELTSVASTARTNLGLGTAATFASSAFDAAGSAAAAQAASQTLNSNLSAIAALTTDAFGRGVLIQTSAANVRSYIGAGSSSFDGVFASLSSKPTTISGYGITDFNSLGDARWSLLAHTHDASTLTGTTLASTVVTSSITQVGTKMQFGGTAGTFPMWKRNGPVLQARLADDTDYCQVQAQTLGNATPPAASYVLYFSSTASMFPEFLVNSSNTNHLTQLRLSKQNGSGSYILTNGGEVGLIAWNSVTFLKGIATSNVFDGFSNVDLVIRSQNAAGTYADRVLFTAEGQVYIGTNASTPSGMLHIVPSAAATVGLYMKGYVGQSGDYLKVVDSSSAAIFKVTSAGYVVTEAPLRLKGYLVANLPAGTQGDTAYVTNALAPTFLVAVAGGGSVVTTVFYNGTTWVSQ